MQNKGILNEGERVCTPAALRNDHVIGDRSAVVPSCFLTQVDSDMRKFAPSLEALR